MADPVVLVVPTIQDGTVVRWYRDLLAARNGRAWATASRNGVVVEFAPRALAEAAYDAHELLAADRNADMSGLATHRRNDGLLAHELVPVDAPEPESTPAFKITMADRFGGHPR
jgi:hypothetical protein